MPKIAPARKRAGLSAATIEVALVWSLLILPLAISVFAGFHFDPLPGRPADFAIFRTAADIVKSGAGGRLYDLETQQRAFRNITSGRYEHFLVWNHHPAEAILYLPASLWTYESGWRIAQWVNVAVLCALAAWTAAKAGRSSGKLMLLLAVLLCGVPCFASAITMGQDSLWILALLLAALGAAEGRPDFAGVLLGLASVKFTIVVPLIAILAINKYMRVAAVAAGVAGAVTLIPAVLLGPGVLTSYWQLCRDLVKTDGRWGLYSELLWNFRGIALRWVQSPAHRVLLTAAAGLVFAFTLRSAPRWAVPGLALLGATVFSPHVYRHDAVMYAGSVMILLNCRAESKTATVAVPPEAGGRALAAEGRV